MDCLSSAVSAAWDHSYQPGYGLEEYDAMTTLTTGRHSYDLFCMSCESRLSLNFVELPGNFVGKPINHRTETESDIPS